MRAANDFPRWMIDPNSGPETDQCPTLTATVIAKVPKLRQLLLFQGARQFGSFPTGFAAPGFDAANAGTG